MQRFACWFDIGFGAADVQHSCLGSGVEGAAVSGERLKRLHLGVQAKTKDMEPNLVHITSGVGFGVLGVV